MIIPITTITTSITIYISLLPEFTDNQNLNALPKTSYPIYIPSVH